MKEEQLTNEVFIALGSNVGDRASYISNAIALLGNNAKITIHKQSSVIETKPFGPVEQGLFLNAVIEIATSLSPSDLLDVCLSVEEHLGRVRTQRWGPRTIDLDIVLFADYIIDQPNLKIPHPELPLRDFVLKPLVEINPTLKHPMLGITMTNMLNSTINSLD